MHTKQNVINDMLGNIKDPKARNLYGAIVAGEVYAQVKCLSKTCKGRVIAFIDRNGRVDETEPVVDPKGKYGLYKSGLEGSRQRLDGQMGFRCYCGNSSILCKEETGIITPARPTQEAVAKVAERLSKRTGNEYLPKNGETEIDGFIIEEIKV